MVRRTPAGSLGLSRGRVRPVVSREVLARRPASVEAIIAAARMRIHSRCFSFQEIARPRPPASISHGQSPNLRTALLKRKSSDFFHPLPWVCTTACRTGSSNSKDAQIAQLATSTRNQRDSRRRAILDIQVRAKGVLHGR